MNSRVKSCLSEIRKVTDFVPKVALVLGTGLGDLVSKTDIVCEIDYSSLPDFPVSTAPTHAGRFVFCKIGDLPVVIMQGRVHFYEGYTSEDISLPIHLMKALGADVLFLTNAAGGINEQFSAGDMMLITDHISCFVRSPLIGKNDDTVGPRFPDMTNVYDSDLCDLIKSTAEKLSIPLRQGVYVQLSGPQYETPAEIRMLRACGADAVGMSTAVEAIVALHCGMKVCGISCIANLASGMNPDPIFEAEVELTASRTAPLFQSLVMHSLAEIQNVV